LYYGAVQFLALEWMWVAPWRCRRLVGTTLLESGVLSVSGAALGLALAYFGVRASGRALAQFLPRTDPLRGLSAD
jgi:hypothetical protein